MAERVAIVGAGVLGLELARRFAERGDQVILLEAASEIGGLASAWSIGELVWDRHYHVTLLSDDKTRRFLKHFDLENELQWVETKTGFYTDGQLYSLSNSWEFLTFPPLGLLSKFRLALTILRASRIKNWSKLEQIPVAHWLKRWSGEKTFQKMWLPLLRAKLGEGYQQTSAAFIWATINRMYAARRSGLKKEMFGYVKGGYARILKRCADVLAQRGVDLRTEARVKQIESGRITLDSGEEISCDRIVVTAASPLAAKLCPTLPEAERQALGQIRYQGIVCASLVLKQPLDRFYVTNLTENWVPFTAVIEMSALVDRAEFNGHTLVYLPKYVAPDDPLFEEPDQSIQARFLEALARIYPHFHSDQLLAFRVSRVRNVFDLSTLNYSQKVPPIVSKVAGLAFLNSAHIVNGTLNVNDTLGLVDTYFPAISEMSPAKKPTPVVGATS